MVITSAPIRFNKALFRIELRRSSSILKNDLKPYTDQLQKEINRNPFGSSRKVELKKQAEILISSLELQEKRELSDAELSELRTRLNDQKSSLDQYLKTSQLSPDEVRQINKIKNKIEKLLKEPQNEAKNEIKSKPTTDTSDRLSKHENITRDQILSRQSKAEPFAYERDFHLNELISKSAEKSGKSESQLRQQNLLPASSLLTSTMDRFITRELTRSINATPAISNITIQNLVSGLNAELSRLLSQPKAEFTCRIVYEELQHRFGIQISGKLSEAEIVKSINQVIADKPGEKLPLLFEAASQLIDRNPEDKADILRLVSEILNPKQTVLTSAVIPALLADHTAAGTNNPIVNKVIEPVIIGLAQNIINQANETASINMVGKSKTEQDIPTLIVLANRNNLPAQLNINTARALLEMMKEAQECMKLVGVKNLDRAKNRIEASQKRRNKATNPSTMQNQVRKTKTEPSLTKIVNARKALQELVRTAETANLAIPKTLYYVIYNIYAGLAGLTPQMQKRTILPFETANFEESRATSSLKQVLAALEADIVGRDPSNQARRLVLAAEILLYGIIMRRVKADINKVDEIIKAIKKHKKLLTGLIENIKNGNEENTVDFIDNLIMQADKLSTLKNGFDEEDLNQALETVLTLAGAKKEVSLKSAEVYSTAV